MWKKDSQTINERTKEISFKLKDQSSNQKKSRWALIAILHRNQLPFDSISIIIIPSRRYYSVASFSQSNLLKMTFGLKLKKNEQFSSPHSLTLDSSLAQIYYLFSLFKPHQTKMNGDDHHPLLHENPCSLCCLKKRKKKGKQIKFQTLWGMTFLCISYLFLHLLFYVTTFISVYYTLGYCGLLLFWT